MSENFKQAPISSLCSSNEGNFTFHYFKCATPLFPILPQFTLLMKVHQTRIFRTFWDAEVERLKYSQPIQFSDVVEEIWKPAFDNSCQFLESLKDRSIKLVDVDELLDQKNFEIEIKTLEKGICSCTKVESKSTWIEPCIQRMKDYRSLRQHANAAKAFLKLKKTLKLNGDFTKVEELGAKV